MSQTLEKRVKDLEKKVALLSQNGKKDWRRTIGIFKDDLDFEQAIQLGRDYRKRQTYKKELARR